MSTETRNTAKSLFLALTDGTGIIDRLYGPSQAPNRAMIISALLDKKITKSNPQAGWHRFRDGMLNLYDVATQGLCIAKADDALAEAATVPEPVVSSRPTRILREVSGPAGLLVLVSEPNPATFK